MSQESHQNKNLKLAIGHRSADVREKVSKLLIGLGHRIVGCVDNGPEFENLLRNNSIDVALAGVEMEGKSGLDVLIDVGHEKAVPAIIITPKRSMEIVEKALEDHVMAYMVEPIDVDELLPIIHLVLRRFEHFQELKAEAKDLQQALKDRKLVERAKGVLMATEAMSEAEAHSALQKRSKDQRKKMIVVAQDILNQIETTSH